MNISETEIILTRKDLKILTSEEIEEKAVEVKLNFGILFIFLDCKWKDRKRRNWIFRIWLRIWKNNRKSGTRKWRKIEIQIIDLI